MGPHQARRNLLIRPLSLNDAGAVARLRPRLLSFHDFVEQALFNRHWGYYATGAVRFGDGGHFDTYPLALSPYFGAMVARRACKVWKGLGRPRRFELCEVGAGNGQLCLDVLTFTAARAVRQIDWRAFESALAYRIVEKSPALRRRQAALLGPLASRVAWSALDLSRRRNVARQGAHGLVVANEVLDCLAHEKVVLGRDGIYRVAFVGASRFSQGQQTPATAVPSARSLLSPAHLDAALARGERLEFREFLLPLESVGGLDAFLRRHYPARSTRRSSASLPWTYFACPAIETFVRNCGALYDSGEILLIDYGGGREYHLGTPGAKRVAAGRPEEKGTTPYRAPGRDDITFLVDFSVAMDAAQSAGLEVIHFGPQGKLAALSDTTLGPRAVADIISHRALTWVLAVAGVGPEHRQRSTALSWTRPPGRRSARTLAQETREAVDEFLGRRESSFQLLLLRKGAAQSRKRVLSTGCRG